MPAGARRLRARADADAFEGAPELQRLRVETAALLRRVAAPGGSSKRQTRRRRETIEVLDVGDEEGDELEAEAEQVQAAAEALEQAGDPFGFEAERARVHRAADTFRPDQAPAKRALERQREELDREQARLERIARGEEDARARRRAAAAEGFAATNRLEASAVKVSTASR